MKTKIIFGLLWFSLLSSCAGSSSDALKDYEGMQFKPVSEQEHSESKIVSPELIGIKIVGESEEANGQFVEGLPGEVKLQVTRNSTKISGSQYRLDLVGFSTAGDQPKIVATEQIDIYKILWTPRLGTVLNGTWGRLLKAEIRITVTGATDSLLVGVSKTKVLNFIVSRTNSQPLIEGHSKLEAGVDEAVEFPVTFEVHDPGTPSRPGSPTLTFSPYEYANTEAYRADGSQYLAGDRCRNNPESIGEAHAGRWKFHCVLRVVNLPLDRDRRGREIPSASSVDMCFHVRAISVIGTLSTQQQVCTVARYAAQPPQLILSNEAQKPFSAGVEKQFSFKISAAHNLSEIEFKNPLNQINSLSGKKNIHCDLEDPAKKNSQVCVVTWTPACVKEPQLNKLNLKATSTLETKVKTANLILDLTVTPNAEACAVPPKKGEKP